VTSPRKLASTNGISVTAAPVPAAPIAVFEPVARDGMVRMVAAATQRPAR
jgi:hypothetical protein